jgi:3',5'-cyclic-AMP phosphodiesterase
VRSRPASAEVFAVEDDAVQLSWSSLPPGRLSVTTDGVEVSRDHPGGPGALTIEGLEPSRAYRLLVRGSVPGHTSELTVRTLAPPPGRPLFRLATISDLHLGIDHFGVLHTMRESRRFDFDEPHAVRCAGAAVRESLGWGAQRLFVKGDVTDRGHPDEWAQAGKLLSGLPVPVVLIPGNHDVDFPGGAIDPIDGAGAVGLDLVRASTAVDVDGLRVVLFDSTGGAKHQGGVDPTRAAHAVDLVSAAGGGCLLLTHHNFQRSRVPWFWPPGIQPGGGGPFLQAVADANPDTLVSSGHTHRHRRRAVGPVQVTEVGSPKDYPGTWAGYVVHEGGIRQVVRRVESPDAIVWNEYTGGAAMGAWRRWSPGRLSDRCFTMTWR